VKRTHQNIETLLAGVAVDKVSPRFVGMHHQRFSPPNAQMLLERGANIHSFFALAQFDTRQVISYHVFPGNDRVEKELTDLVYNSEDLADVIVGLLGADQKALHNVGTALCKIFEAFLEKPEQLYK